MSEDFFISDAIVNSKGQVTIPEKVRAMLDLKPGKRVCFIVSDNEVKIVNSAVYAMKILQEEMKDSGKDVGFLTEEDVAKWLSESRVEDKK